MSAGSFSQTRQIRQILESCRRQILQHTLLVGTATLLITVAVGLLAAGLLDYLLGLSAWLRVFTLASFVGVVGFVAWKFLIAPLKSAIPLNQLGAVVDLSCPELKESLATLISIQRPEASASESGSAVMRNRLQQQISERLGNVDSPQFVDGGKMVKRCGTAAICLTALLLPVVFWPSGSNLLMHRMLNPFANLATATNLYFEVADGHRTVARGSTVTISASPAWRTGSTGERPELVKLELIALNAQKESLAMAFDEVGGSYTIDLARIAESVQFRIYGGGATTQIFALNVVDAPQVTAAVMTVTPPTYIGRAIERFDGMLGDMPVFERSRMEILLEFNKPVASAALVWNRRDARPATDTQLFDREFDNITGEELVTEKDLLNMDPDAPLPPEREPLAVRVEGILSQDGQAAVFNMLADVGGDFVFEVLDEHKLKNLSEPDRMITVVYDSPPKLQVSGVRAGDRFRPEDVLPVNCLVTDDIGIGDLELHFYRNEDVAKIMPALDFDRGATEVRHSFRLSLADLGVVEDDKVTLRVRAADERPEPGPQQVWWNEVTITIDGDAEAAGARALEQQTREMVDALKQIEEQLRKDTDKANDLKERAATEWTDESREEAEALSEKEQQQGRLLEEITKEVATHPMMKAAAEKLQQLSSEVRDKLPEVLDKAVDGDRQDAGEALQASAEKLEEVRRELHQEIETIEEIARLEQKLSELNRLALDAEQLAADSQQLDDDRKKPEDKPEEIDDQQWNQELDQRQQELSQERAELSEDLERLLREERELLEAAQRAQKERLDAIAAEARELARREEQVAEGVSEEAREAGLAARQVADDLQAVQKQAEQKNMARSDQGMPTNSTDLQPLQKAVDELRQGNLAEPRDNVDQVASELAKDQQTADVTRQLNDISDRIQQLRQDRNASKPRDSATESADGMPTEPSDTQAAHSEKNQIKGAQPQGGMPAKQQPDQDAAAANAGPVQELLGRVNALADATQAAADLVNADPNTSEGARQSAVEAAEKAQNGSEEAAAGKFAKAADQLRNAAKSASSSADQLQADGSQQEDLPNQVQGVRDELNRMADVMQSMQQDNSSQAMAQQQTQKDIARQASELPEKLRELAERMAMDALEMQPESQQAQNAQQVAEQAQQSSQRASSELQQGQLQQAGKSGEQAADQLKQIADIAENAGQRPGENQSPIPTEVGESVADALQDLEQAAQAMQQSGQSKESGEAGEQAEQSTNDQQGQPAEVDQSAAATGQPGEQGPDGQPSEKGQGEQGPAKSGKQGKPSGSQQLSAAAKALAQAAQDALPGQFNPGQMPESGEPSQAGRDAMGNAALWDGRVPDDAGKGRESRNWGQQNEELETETSDTAGVSHDSEYQALIRMYFREVARATASE